MHDFPFDITDVCRINFLEIPKSGKVSDITCPFCGSKKKFNVNAAPNKNIARCNKCGWGGGMLKLHAKLNNMNTKEAKKDIEEKLNLVPSSEDYKKRSEQIKKIAEASAKEEVIMPISQRSSKYNHMISLLHLAEDHKENLELRGLKPSFIEARGYKSLPVEADSLTRLARKMQSDGYSVKNLPGFYLNDNNEYQLRRFTRGTLIPIRNLNGYIEGFQVRKDNDKIKYKTHKDHFTGEIILGKDGKPEKFATNKFNTISTPPEEFKDGGKMHSVCHYAGSWNWNEEIGELVPVIKKNSIKFTEGPLKADIFYALTGEPMLAILGVNNVKQLKVMLEQLLKYYPNIDTVENCLDMDYMTNIYVQKAVTNCKEMIEALGLKYIRREWNPEYKGIDDFALAVKKGIYKI